MIVDACMFYNELEMLDLRMHELDSVVDKFVIVESEETIGSSAKRKSCLLDNWSVVKPFEHKLHYKLLPKLEPPFTGQPGDPWGRERYQRNWLFTAAQELNLSPSDVCIFCDADEIPRATCVTENLAKLDKGICRLAMKFFYYNVNNFLGTWTRGATMGRVVHYEKVSPEDSRYKNQDNEHMIEDAGWHFSYFGGVEKIKEKVAHFSHALDGICTDFMARSDEEAVADIVAGRDLYRRAEMNAFTKCATDDPTLPAYFLANVDKFKHFTEEGFKEAHAALLK